MKDAYAREQIASLQNTIENLPSGGGGTGNNNSVVVTTLPSTGDANTDYYLLRDNVYVHYKWINNAWEQIGSYNSGGSGSSVDTYSQSEIDTMIGDVEDRIAVNENDISVLKTKVDSVGTMVSDITGNSEELTLAYSNNTTKKINIKDSSIVVQDANASTNGILLEFTDGSTKELEISGGGGGTTSGTAIIRYVTPQSVQTVLNSSCPIEYTFTATDSAGDSISSGAATWYVNNIQVATSTAYTDRNNIFDIGSYLRVGTNNVRLSIGVDTGGASLLIQQKVWSVNAINLTLEWDYNDTTINTAASTILRWTPFGDVSKTTHVIIDGTERTDLQTTTTRSGQEQTLVFDKLSHGSHTVVLYLTATVNNVSIESQRIMHDMIFVDTQSDVPIIASSFTQSSMMQYDTVAIPIMVYNPTSTTSTVKLSENGVELVTWDHVDRTIHNWNYSPSTYGAKVLTITCGNTTKTINLDVEQLDIDNEEISGYDFRLKASELAGNVALQNWSSNGVTATFSENFDWNNGGIKTETDANGNIQQYICIKAGTTMTINYKLFADDPTVNGKSFKMIYKLENVRNYDTTVASCIAEKEVELPVTEKNEDGYDVPVMVDDGNGNLVQQTETVTSSIGMRLDAHQALFKSAGTSVTVPYGEDEYIEIEFDIYPAPNANNSARPRYIMAWIDGVITSCRVYNAGDNFTHPLNNQKDIVIGSSDCDVYVYMVKNYSTYMTRANHIANFIADAPNAPEMVRRFDRNDILDATGRNIDYQKLIDKNPDCRVWLYDIPYMTNGKKDKVKNCKFNQFWKNGKDYYKLTGTCTMTVQGTSSVKYIHGAANTDSNFTSLADGNGNDLMANSTQDEDYGNNWYIEDEDNPGHAKVFDVVEGEELGPECIAVERDSNRNITKYIKAVGFKINDDSCPITYSNTKVNFASCEQVNNMCNAIWYQRFNPYPSLTPHDCMEFNMGVQFIKDSGTIPDESHFVLWGDNDYHFYSIANMGNSKKNVHVFHDLSNPLECCIEVNDNDKEQMRMVNDDLSMEDWSGDVFYGMRYPDTKNPSQEIRNAWQRLVTWFATNNPNAATNDVLDTPETYGVYTFRGHDRAGTQVLRGTTVKRYAGTYTNDTFDRRMAKMLNECEDYLVMDSFVYHFVYLERHTMVDNVSKNNFWSSTDLIHWDLSKAYDMDTSDGNNNQGQMVFDYGNEYNDYIGDQRVFNGGDSVWFVFVANLYEACQTMFTNRESLGAWSSTAYHNFLLSEQQKIPERCWVECYWYDYLRTYEDGISAEWMTFLDGGQKTHQRKHYEYFEELYDSSKYRGNVSTSQNINFRAYTPATWSGVMPKSEFTITMYNKMYLSVDVGTTALDPIKIEKGVPYTLNFAGRETSDDEVEGALNNTLIAINTAPMIQSVSGMEQLYPDTCVFSYATRLRELTIGSTATGYSNTFLKTLSLDNNTMLERLYVQNLKAASSSLDLSNCTSLIEIDATGSAFTGYTFATGGQLAKASLGNPTSLVMRDLQYITDNNFYVASYRLLDTLRFENCPNLDSLSIVNAAVNLTRLRITDIDWVVPETSMLNRLLDIIGLNEEGNNVIIVDSSGRNVPGPSVVTGQAYISGAVRNQELLNYENAWPSLTVTYDAINLVEQYLVTYVNADADNTVLYRTYVDRGEAAPDPYAEGYIVKPTLEMTQQYTYDFGTTENGEYVVGSGWNGLSGAVVSDRTITAVYTSTIRTYVVNWYSRAGLLLDTQRKSYGSEAIFSGDTPTRTDEESTYIYNIFMGWNKSTGFVKPTSDNPNGIDVYAIWDRKTVPPVGTDLKDMSIAQIYGICQEGKMDDYFVDKDYIDIPVGFDPTYTNVNSEVLLENQWFDGTNVIETNIKLFDENAESFTLAIDYEFVGKDVNSTLVGCYEEDGFEGFRLRYYNNYPNIQWGNTNIRAGSIDDEGMIVLRHIKGSNQLYVYDDEHGDLYLNNTYFHELPRNKETLTELPLVFGGVKFPDGTYDYYATGWIHWCKIWYDDLGDNVCKEIVNSLHETWRMEYCGSNRYRLGDGLSGRTRASFVMNNCLKLRGQMNATNTNEGGYPATAIRTILNNRIYKSFPIYWRTIMKKSRIYSSAGNQSTDLIYSDDYVYLCSLKEVDNSQTESPYIDEGDHISFFTDNFSRIKYPDRILRDDVVFMTESTDPTLLTTTYPNLKEGDIWRNLGSYNNFFYYISYETSVRHIRYMGQKLSDSTNIKAQGTDGMWVYHNIWWLRSPRPEDSMRFWGISPAGALNYAYFANYAYNICPCFSI